MWMILKGIVRLCNCFVIALWNSLFTCTYICFN